MSRQPVDWRRLAPDAALPAPYTHGLDASLCEYRTRYTSEDDIRRLNAELIVRGHRQNQHCVIGAWEVDHPDVFYTDGRGFVLAECVLRDYDTEFPFHEAEMGVLNLLNICPIQLSANGWRILKAFVIKCHKEGVEPTARLFFFFFSSKFSNTFVSLHRRNNRPQILENCLSHPKGWQGKFVFIKGSSSVRPWWVRASDDRPLFPLCWQLPRSGVLECDWEDLSVVERRAVLRLATTLPMDPQGMLTFRRRPVSLGAVMGGPRRRRKTTAGASSSPNAPVPRRSTSVVIREAVPPAPEEVSAADPRGKRPVDAEVPPPSKRARVEGVCLVPPSPALQEFNPYAVADQVWSPEAAVERDSFVRSSRLDERDPTLDCGRLAFALLQNLQAAYISRRDILEERDAAISDRRSFEAKASSAESELVLLRASNESLQCGLEQAKKKIEDLEAESATFASQVVELQDKLKEVEASRVEDQAASDRNWRWLFNRFGYRCFKNAVNQLRVHNPNLDTTYICPNKEVFDGVIRDRLDGVDVPEDPFPPPPETFGTDAYISDGDGDFPWYMTRKVLQGGLERTQPFPLFPMRGVPLK